MCSITDMCFMCTRNNNCSLVNDRIVSQIEYLLPEITIFKLGVPLQICCTCEKKLQSFNEFKNFCVGNSLRLEERIKKEQSNRDSTAHLLSESCTMINDNTTVGPNSNVEDISIKEEPCEETSDEREYYNNVVKNMTETDCATDNDENCNKNNQICTKYDTEDKSAIPGTSDQQFEEIYIKPEIEDGSMDFENCDDVLMTETIENNQNALSKSGNTSSCVTIMEQLLPEKSKETYKKIYQKFCSWRFKKDAPEVTEAVVLNYISEHSKSLSYWSMLKACLITYENVDIRKFPKVKALLKANSRGARSNKSRRKVLSRDDVLRFLHEASDEAFLLVKTILVMGIAGGCCIGELVNMKIDDVDVRGNILVVTLPNIETSKPRVFTMTNEVDVNAVDIYKKYVQLRPQSAFNRRLFLNYQNGKCTIQPVGENKIRKMPSVIATFLGLPEPALYTGHVFRRSSASLS